MPLLLFLSIELTNVHLNYYSTLKRNREDVDDTARLREQVESLKIENKRLNESLPCENVFALMKVSEQMFRQKWMTSEWQQW